MLIEKARTQKDFWGGLLVGGLVAVGVNLLPSLLSRRAPEHCGFEIMGFPFVFRIFGGYSGQASVYWSALVADIVIAVMFALALGLLKRRSSWASFFAMVVGSTVGGWMILAYRGFGYQGGRGYPFAWQWWTDIGINNEPFSGYRWVVLAADVLIWIAVIAGLGVATKRIVKWVSSSLFRRRDAE